MDRFQLTVEDALSIGGRGVVAPGRVQSGVVAVGDTVKVGDVSLTVRAIEIDRRATGSATAGDAAGLRFDADAVAVVVPGAVLTGA